MTAKELPNNILSKAINLRNSIRTIYISLYSYGQPATAIQIAQLVGHARAYVNMRLNQLEDMGLVKSSPKGKEKLFEVIMEG